MRYVPLHVHTEYSLLDGAIKNKKYIEYAQKNGFEAVAITDHGNMCGALELYQLGKKENFKTILGCEFYVFHGDITKQDPNDRKVYHLVLLAKNNQGYQNLVKLVSIAHIQGYYYRPRINREILEQHAEGLICLSACIQGEVSQEILNGTKEGARETATWYKNLFKDDFYLEIQDHGIPEQRIVNQYLAEMSKKLNIKLVATNDVHYLNKEDAEMQDVLMCVQMGKQIDDPDRLKFSTDEFYLKTYEEMKLAMQGYEEALETTIEIADKCDLVIKSKSKLKLL